MATTKLPPKTEPPPKTESKVPAHEHPELREYRELVEQLTELVERLVPLAVEAQAARQEVFEAQTLLRQDMDKLLDKATRETKSQAGQLRGVVRALLTIFEAGRLNTEQAKALRTVRVIIGDAYGTGCTHENVAYEEGDALICQDCREVVGSADSSG